MIKTLRVFEKYKLDDINFRREWLKAACFEICEENILYAICSYDYFYKPDDDKLSGLYELFIKNNAELMINVSFKSRRDAVKLLESPQIKVKPPHLAGSKKKHHLFKFSFFRKRSGAASGGVANWNLMTQAIELTLSECMGQINSEKMQLFLKGEGGFGDKKNQPPPPFPPRMNRNARLIANYWGAGVMMLGIT